MQNDHPSEPRRVLPDQRQREAVCRYCGHGQDLHSGGPVGQSDDPSRPLAPGWCVACDAHRRGGSTIPMCWWFVA